MIVQSRAVSHGINVHAFHSEFQFRNSNWARSWLTPRRSSCRVANMRWHHTLVFYARSPRRLEAPAGLHSRSASLCLALLWRHRRCELAVPSLRHHSVAAWLRPHTTSPSPPLSHARLRWSNGGLGWPQFELRRRHHQRSTAELTPSSWPAWLDSFFAPLSPSSCSSWPRQARTELCCARSAVASPEHPGAIAAARCARRWRGWDLS
jgi:hypothetical protein